MTNAATLPVVLGAVTIWALAVLGGLAAIPMIIIEIVRRKGGGKHRDL